MSCFEPAEGLSRQVEAVREGSRGLALQGVAPEANRPGDRGHPRSSRCRRACIRASPGSRAPGVAPCSDGEAVHEALHGLRRHHEQTRESVRQAPAAVGHRCQPPRPCGPAMGTPVKADDRAPRRPVRLRMPWRWSRASGPSNAGPDARPCPGAHRRWRAVRSRQHPRAVSLEELGQRSAPR